MMLALMTTIQSAPADGDDDGCGWLGNCGQSFLNVATAQGAATVSVGPSCAGDWHHNRANGDARQTVCQWLNGQADKGRGSLGVPPHPRVSEVRITSTGGHCGFDADDLPALAVASGSDRMLRFGFGNDGSVDLSGCHAGIGNDDIGRMTHGGILVEFADGYAFGDSFASSHSYGVYGGSQNRSVLPFTATVYALSEFNTDHYRIDTLAEDRGNWRWGYDNEGSAI